MKKSKKSLKKEVREFRKRHFGFILDVVFAKLLFGVGLGFILASYMMTYNIELIGWIILVVSLVLHIPIFYELLWKKGG